MSRPHLSAGLVAAALAIACGAPAALGQATTEDVRYRVNYRPSDKDPWQTYAVARDRTKADSIAAEVKQTGYQSEVVDGTTPTPQPYPDAADTSASSYYPTSNWAADYNQYVVPGGDYNYGWYGGWNPWYRNRVYTNYWANNGRNWNNGWYRGGGWYGGWNRGTGWGNGWNHSHRNYNYNHGDRGSHYAHHERHAAAAHHSYPGHRATAGHHAAGHHAAAWHGNHASGEHRGTGHFGGGARTGGHRGGAHHASGHGRAGAGHHNSAGRHAGGHHARHLDP
jgi:hypothetical protein